jgi:hypothetical protein
MCDALFDIFLEHVSGIGMGAAVDFFNQVNLLFGTLTEFCTPENCPTMSAGPKYVLLGFLRLILPLFCVRWDKPQDRTLIGLCISFVNLGQI